MAYATYEDLIERYPAMKDIGVNKDSGSVNSGFIYPAEVQINGMLGICFDVPLGNHPTVKDLVIDLTYNRVMLSRNPKVGKELMKDFMDRINRLKSGEEAIYTGSGTALLSSGKRQDTVWSNEEDYYPVHTMLGAEHPDTRVSSEYRDELEEERD